LSLGLSDDYRSDDKADLTAESEHAISYSGSYAPTPAISSASPVPVGSRSGSVEPSHDHIFPYSYASALPIISSTSSSNYYPTTSIGSLSYSESTHQGMYLPYQGAILSAQSSSHYLPSGSTSRTIDPSLTNSERVIDAPKESRCWEHGCNGRAFSTHSNYLRHLREKSGQSTKSTCPRCGQTFTRKTAMNGHMLHEKCKRRSEHSSSSDRSGGVSRERR